MIKGEKSLNRDLRPRFTFINKLGYAATACSIMFANTDKAIGDLVWNGTETKLVAENELQPGLETWVIVPGLGVQSGSGIASALDSTLGHRSNLVYFNYSDNGATIDTMATSLISLHDTTKAPINIYAHSMGGSITLQTLQRLKIQIPINTIIFDCSPYNVNDAYNPATPISSEILPRYGGGFFSKIIFEAANNTWLHKNDQLSSFEQIKDAIRIAITGSSPRLFTNQLGVLGDTDMVKTNKSIKENTRIIYLRPKEATADDTVNVKTAIEKFKLIFGEKLIVVHINNGKHASPTLRPSEYNEALWPYVIGQLEEPLLK